MHQVARTQSSPRTPESPVPGSAASLHADPSNVCAPAAPSIAMQNDGPTHDTFPSCAGTIVVDHSAPFQVSRCPASSSAAHDVGVPHDTDSKC